MNLNNHRRTLTFAILFAVLTLGLVIGCTSRSATQKPEEALKKRAQQYWQYRIKGELTKAYDYEHPLIRKKFKLGPYTANIGADVKYFEFKIDKIVVDGDQAKVYLYIRYAIPLAAYFPKEGITRKIIDRWAQQDGVWYHLLGGLPGKKSTNPQ